MAPATADSARAAGPVKALVIDNFALTQGRIVFEDLSRKVPMRKDIDSLNLSAQEFHDEAPGRRCL